MADLATLVFDIDSSQADGAARALAGLNRYAAATATASAKLETQFRRANGQFQSQIEYVANNEQAIRRLADAYNPVLSAQLRFAEAQKDVAHAVQLGVIPSGQQADILRRLELEYGRAANSGTRFFRVVGGGAGQIQNASYQIGDFFVQIASGQNVMMALSQQLPQLLGGFGAIGVAAGAATAILGAVWMIMGNGEDSAKRLSTALDSLNRSIADVRRLSESVNLSGLDALRERYGRVDSQVRTLIENQVFYNNLLASKDLKDSLSALADFAGPRWGDFNISDQVSGVLRLQEAFKLARGDAESVKWAFDEVAMAKGLKEQEIALTRLSNYLKIVLSNTEDVTREQLETFNAVNSSLDAVKQLLAAAGQMPGAFHNAASAASAITDELNRAVNAAARLAASGISDARFAQIELDFRTDKIGKAGAIAAAKFDAEVGKAGMDQGLFNRLRNQAIAGAKEAATIMAEVDRLNEADRDAAKKSKSGGAKAAAELKAAEKGFQSLRELLEQESMFQVAEYEKRQAQLDNALAKKLVSEQQYQLFRSQLQTFYFGTEYEKQQLQYTMEQEQLDLALAQKLISEQRYRDELSRLHAAQNNATLQGYDTFFGNLASAAKAGGDKASAAVRAFSVAQGIINSYLAYTQVLSDPSLIGRPFLRKALAASTLAAGLSAVASMKSSGGGGGGGTSAATASASARAEPQRSVLVTLTGDEFLVNMADEIMTKIYDETGNGRVVVQRNYS